MDLSDLVAGPVVATTRATTLADVAQLMDSEGVGSVAILDDNNDFVGIVTDRDIVSAVARGHAASVPADEIMTPTPDTVDINTEVSDAVSWMNATGYRHLPVTDGGRLVGMISIKDLLWAIAGS